MLLETGAIGDQASYGGGSGSSVNEFYFGTDGDYTSLIDSSLSSVQVGGTNGTYNGEISFGHYTVSSGAITDAYMVYLGYNVL